MIDYKEFKQNQVARYEKKARQHRNTTRVYLFISVCLWGAMIGLGTFVLLAELEADTILISIIIIACSFFSGRFFWMLRRNAGKSWFLLEQLASELMKVLNNSRLDLEEMKAEVLSVETRFLANDDELYTKKFIWQPFLAHMEEKHSKGKDAKKLRLSIPAVWMAENPLDIDDNDGDFVNLNWEIKREFRQLSFKNYGTQREILAELSEEARQSFIVFERFLRSKKVSKKLKKFKTASRVFYMNVAAKMRLIAFVDSVLLERPYVEHCEEMVELIKKKNIHIRKVMTDFWIVHRRILLFYALELACLALIVPVIMISTTVSRVAGSIPAAFAFFAASAIVAYVVMVLVRHQLRDLKSKKLVPGLVASLIAIRHSMCSTVVLDKDVVKKYEEYFEKVGKRFMLTVTDIDAVDYAKEHVAEKIEYSLAGDTLSLWEEKEKQAQKYYGKFQYFQRQCLKYSFLMALAILATVPLYAIFYQLGATIGWNVEGFLHWLVLGVAAVVVVLFIFRYKRVARRKELYLLIYQKLSVVLGDYAVISESRRLMQEFEEVEESIIKTASLDSMPDVCVYVQECQEFAKNS